MKKLFAIVCATALLGTSTLAGQWTQEQENTFSIMLYEAGKSDGNWEGHLDDFGLKSMTDCIAEFYSNTITYDLALEYYETMPPAVNEQFQIVLGICFQKAKEQESTFI